MTTYSCIYKGHNIESQSKQGILNAIIEIDTAPNTDIASIQGVTNYKEKL